MKKLLIANVAVIGLLLAGPQKASADVVYACVNTTTGLLYVVSATTNCPSASSGATWIKINWNATAGGQAANVLYTPPLNLVDNGTATCTAVNTAAQSRAVTLEQFNASGQVNLPLNTTISPGGIALLGNAVNAGQFYCRFTVTNGTSSDIRGSLQVCIDTACIPMAPQ
jgi:hypothetical protein